MNAEAKSRILTLNGYEYTQTTSGLHTWWFDGMAIAESESRLKAADLALEHHKANKQEALAQAANDAAGEAAYNEAVEELRQQLADAQARIDAAVAIVEKGLLNPLSIEDVILLEGILKPERHAHMEYTAPVADADVPDVKQDNEVLMKDATWPTLFSSEIDWLARNILLAKESHSLTFYNSTDAAGMVGRVTHNLHTCIMLNSEYDTPANRAAIEARRQELGL